MAFDPKDNPLSEVKVLGQDEIDAVDYIEAECEFVKEDVSDGHYGYFKVYPKDLEEIRKMQRYA